MRTTIDAAGRIVIPKGIRDALDLGTGGEVDVTARDGRIEITVPPTPMRLVRAGKGLAAAPQRVLPPLDPAQVRATLEQMRR